MDKKLTAVAVIPPGLSLNTMPKVMAGIGLMYPKHSLYLRNDDRTGGYLVLHDPTAKPGPDTSGKPTATVAAGKDAPGDLIEFAMVVSGRDAELGAKALGVWLAERLADAGAANYLTYSIALPDDGGEYAVTIQRVGGKTPAERIAELEERVAALTEVAEVAP